MKKLFSFLVLFLLAVSINANSDGSTPYSKDKISECPYLQKMHADTQNMECPYLQSKIQSSENKESECPYLNKKLESKSSTGECPYSGKEKSAEDQKCPYSGKSSKDVKETIQKIKVKIS